MQKHKASSFFHPVLIISAGVRLMSGKETQKEVMLAAVKPLKTANFTAAEDRMPVVRHQLSAADSDSLEGLFQKHHDRVFRTAHRVTGSAADAEDVLQTVFLRVARGQESAGAADNPQAYFARAAINASLDLLRSRKRSKAIAMDDVEDRASVAAFVSKHDPAKHQEDRELRELLTEALARLGETAAQMFALRYFEGFGNGEIASIMKTSPLVVGVTLHRARARLRKEIGRYLQGHGV
ncbi:MAG TPA: sigma-70 family RNA polymerase sigma factor [Pyrinomonadaceae bacterium]|nr:sigma-70 family RNA polymerase sigma factor [Pyrinomonadaceae bacterium]